MTTEDLYTPFKQESGKAVSWALLLCFVISAAYYFGGYQYLTARFSPLYATMIFCGLGVIVVFAFGCALNLAFIGEPSERDFKNSLQAQLKALQDIVKASGKKIFELEHSLGRTSISLSARGLESLALARRITIALDSRVSEIAKLIKKGGTPELIDADELFRSKLSLSEDPMQTLIGTEAISARLPEEWANILVQLFDLINDENRLAA